MGSHKKSALKAQRSSFEASLGDQLASTFEREDARRKQVAQQREAQLRHKACERKKRYSCESEAKLAIRDCESAMGLATSTPIAAPIAAAGISPTSPRASRSRTISGPAGAITKALGYENVPLNQMPPVRASEHTRRRHPCLPRCLVNLP